MLLAFLYITFKKTKSKKNDAMSEYSLRESIQVLLSTLKRFLNRPITKLDNGDDANVIATDLGDIKKVQSLKIPAV